jgi:hypothetical protein
VRFILLSSLRSQLDTFRHPSARPLMCVSLDSSTCNLNKHVQKCDSTEKKPVTSVAMMERFAGGYTREKLRWKLVEWVVKKNRPFAIVEDETLIEIFRMLNSKVNAPSGQTLARDLRLVHEMMLGEVIELLDVSVFWFSAAV